MTVASNSKNPLLLSVDAEHTPARLYGCMAMLAAFIVVFALVIIVTPNGLLLGLVCALVAAALTTFVVERITRGRFSSERDLLIDDETIAIRRQQRTEFEIDPRQQVNLLMWHFVVRRNGRVRKGWHVLGLALEQDDIFVTVYTFAAPPDFEALSFQSQFTLLEKPKDAKANLKVAGLQRRLLTAEQIRSTNGAEVTLEQFQQIIDDLQRRYPLWMLRL